MTRSKLLVAFVIVLTFAESRSNSPTCEDQGMCPTTCPGCCSWPSKHAICLQSTTPGKQCSEARRTFGWHICSCCRCTSAIYLAYFKWNEEPDCPNSIDVISYGPNDTDAGEPKIEFTKDIYFKNHQCLSSTKCDEKNGTVDYLIKPTKCVSIENIQLCGNRNLTIKEFYCNPIQGNIICKSDDLGNNCSNLVHPRCRDYVNNSTIPTIPVDPSCITTVKVKQTFYNFSNGISTGSRKIQLEVQNRTICPGEVSIKGAKFVGSQFLDSLSNDQPSESISKLNDMNQKMAKLGNKTEKKSSLDLSATATVEYGPLSSLSTTGEKEPMLLEVLSSKRKKREVSKAIFVFSIFYFLKDEMRQFLPAQNVLGFSWVKASFEIMYPTDVLPYIGVAVFRAGSGQIKKTTATVTFQINTEADKIKDTKAPPYLFQKYRSLQKILGFSYVCHQLNEAVDPSFTSSGCTTSTQGNLVTCKCDKPSLHALIPVVSTLVRPEALQWIYYIGLIVGMGFLVLTMIGLGQLYKDVVIDRIAMQLNLVSSLLLFNFVMLFEDRAVTNDHVCVFVTFLKHWFMMAAGFFAFGNGIFVLTNTNSRAIRYFRLNSSDMIKVTMFLGWVFSLLVAFITFSVTQPTFDYMERGPYGYYRCWIRSSSIVGAVVIPLAIGFLLSVATYLKTAAFVIKSRFRPKYIMNRATELSMMTVDDVDIDHVTRMLIENVLVLVALMVPWGVFYTSGFYTIDEPLAMLYVGTILISSQSIVVSLIYIFGGKDVLKALKGKISYPEMYNLYWYGVSEWQEMAFTETVANSISSTTREADQTVAVTTL